MRRVVVKVIGSVLVLGSSYVLASANGRQDNTFQLLDDRTQEIKLRVLDLNREVNKYAAGDGSNIAQNFKGKHRAEYSLDFVYRDYRDKQYLSAINRYHSGRDFGVILSKYETALRVANVYLDYGLYHYSKKIFTSLLADEDSAVASLARYYLAKYNYRKRYWNEALSGFESVTDGIPVDMLDKKNIMQSVILQNMKRHDEVIKVLSEVPDSSEYYVYARFNMAMSYLKKGWWSDAEENIRLVLRTLKAGQNITNYLRDRLYLALGYSQLQREYYREAKSSLSNVDTDGPYGYKAVLGLGIVAAEQEQYREALDLLDGLKKSYSKQLVTEEAHIVVPFILESIGSQDVTSEYYTKAIQYYKQTLSEIDDMQHKVSSGGYDNIFNSITYNDSDELKIAELNVKDRVNSFFFELIATAQWRESGRNYQDLKELSQFLEKVADVLARSGKYERKAYVILQRKTKNYKNKINELEKQYLTYLRELIQSHLETRKSYFLSYMNQSKYALARVYDMTLGAGTEILIAGKNISGVDVRALYRDYLATSILDSHNRRAAMVRLAELELDYYDQKSLEENLNPIELAKIEKNLSESVDLMTAALEDYPEHKQNDKLLYQLALAYDKQKQPEKAVTAMRQLVDSYPQSRFYSEVQFKLGESYLTSNGSIDAELAYSAVLQREHENSIFYRRALYKRGWSRLQQSVYEDALDDFFQILELSNFSEQGIADVAEKEFFNDILRAISMCFISMGGLNKLNTYFEKENNFTYAHLAYQKLGELYESQGRYQDAVDTYQAYISHQEMSPYAPQFMLKTISAWQSARLVHKELKARALLETKYTINSPFWSKNKIKNYVNVREALEANVTYMAAHYHGLYQKSHDRNALNQAKYWYDKFDSYAADSKNAGKVFFMYAELLSEAGDSDKALAYYEKTERGNDSSSEKNEAAYAAIVTADNIYTKTDDPAQRKKWLLKKSDYTIKFISMFPDDKRSVDALLHVIDALYTDKHYQRAIEVIQRSPKSVKASRYVDIELFKAHCLFALQDYRQAEEIYGQLYIHPEHSGLDKNLIADRLASAIYKQGEAALQNGKDTEAINQFLKVARKVPDSAYAATAEFDAASVLLKSGKDAQALRILEGFLRKYPRHKLTPNVNNKLAVLYLKGPDKSKSALAFERSANDPANDALTRRDALWQAANIFEEAGDQDKALKLFERFISEYRENHEQAMEAQLKLANLYASRRQFDKQFRIYEAMVAAENNIRQSARTDRTKYLAANASLKLTERDIEAYKNIVIKEPLKKTLKAKKTALQELVNSLAKVNEYAIEETTTRATYYIAEAYFEFSKSLLNSPRPRNLAGLELEQYELLLEEQAFPFEEKAVAFYKENVDSIKTGVYNEWIKQSVEQLSELIPARYKRKEKLDPFINIPLETIGMAVN